MGMVKLSIMGWGDHPELRRWPTAVTRGPKMYHKERLVIFATSVIIPPPPPVERPAHVVLPYCMGRMGTGRCRGIFGFLFLLFFFHSLCVCMFVHVHMCVLMM